MVYKNQNKHNIFFVVHTSDARFRQGLDSDSDSDSMLTLKAWLRFRFQAYSESLIPIPIPIPGLCKDLILVSLILNEECGAQIMS